MARRTSALGALGVLCWLEPTRVLKGLKLMCMWLLSCILIISRAFVIVFFRD